MDTSRCMHDRYPDDCITCLKAELSRLRSENRARQRVLTDAEREDLFLEQCLEHTATAQPHGEDGDPFPWWAWYKEDVTRLVEMVKRHRR